MNPDLAHFAARLRGRLAGSSDAISASQFSALALELFALQFRSNAAYRKICEARGRTPSVVEQWTQIPAVPAAAFKELDLTSLAPGERTAVFHSSGTTGQKPGRHFHSADSLAVYEASLWSWFAQNFSGDSISPIQNSKLVVLTPPPAQVPHSSLVHMFETFRQKLGAPASAFVGRLENEGVWALDFAAALNALSPRASSSSSPSLLLLGTAFSFVHLLDHLVAQDLRLPLPAGSRVMETGGYKNRSRSLPKPDLHALISERLVVPPGNIFCEYGMSELSSQAYDTDIQPPASGLRSRVFRFPPWARVQIVSPETGREVGGGGTGLIRILDLANVFSVAAVQTEDLGLRCGDGFELLGRASAAEPRGCSLMSA